ncbi:cytosine permease, partial [Streptomyces sp. 2MCAF27]
LTLLAVPINAWVGVFAVDLIIRRSYDSAALMDVGRSSRYWFRGGVAWAAMIAWAMAIVVGLLFTEASTSPTDVWFSGPLAHSWIGSNGLGWVVTLTLSAGVYALLRRLDGTVRQEAAGQRPQQQVLSAPATRELS